MLYRYMYNSNIITNFEEYFNVRYCFLNVRLK